MNGYIFIENEHLYNYVLSSMYLNETKKEKDNLECDIYDLYVVMNSMANDYGKVINLEDVDTYIKMTQAFIHDEDATEHKVWKYFTKIAK